ncbi:MAG: hypothetical protein KAJ95_09980 [Gammaproteobacteria bacterium]|nr:hypothetical protein [Gammaproteobacteria bacterium]
MADLLVNISTLLIITACASAFTLSLSKKWRWVIVLCLILLSLIPVAGSSLWLWISGATGQLSIVSLLVLFAFIVRSLTSGNLLETRSRQQLYYLILLAGLLLYPASLGLAMYDPYTLGFGIELSLFLLLLSMIYWFLKYRQLAVIILIVVAAESAGVLTSANTWDYFIDPLLWLFSPVLLIILEIRQRRSVATVHQSTTG